jgi:hypothetical protein
MMRTAALASPLVWFANHTAQFALAPLACRWHSNVVLWVVAAIALALVAASGSAAWAEWGKSAQATEPSAAAVMPPWLAASGVILSASFFIVIVAQMIPTFILGWCA